MSPGNTKFCFAFLISSVIIITTGCATPSTKYPTSNKALVEQEAEKQREIALKIRFEMETKLAQTAYPLLKAATPFCKTDVSYRIGLGAWNQFAFQEDFRKASKKILNTDEKLSVSYVLPGSPAEKSGVMQGDRIISLNSLIAPEGKAAIKWYQNRISELSSSSKPIDVQLNRNNQKILASITPEEICGYEVILIDQNVVNAAADGKRILVAKGLIRFVETDQELSLVLAHEIAHNAMGHIDAKMRNALFGAVFDVLAAFYGINTQGDFARLASQSFSQEFEQEADYIGLYIMAMAGLEIEGSSNFWRRMAAENPKTIKGGFSATHPTTPERFLTIEQTTKEINSTLSSGLSLDPKFK